MLRSTLILTSRRSLSVTPRRANLISDLYIQQIKAFKPTPLSPSDIESAVQKFQLPAKPSIPDTEISADSLGQYEAADVETAPKETSGEAVPVEEDWFVFEEAEDHH